MTPEFSRILPVAQIPAGGLTERVAANEAERHALARRLGLPGIANLEATLAIRPDGPGRYAVDGRIAGRLTQTCVVSTEPFESDVEAEFRTIFTEDGDLGSIEDLLDPEQDLTEPLENGAIDLGELVAQELSLALDPYPHAPGVEPVAGDAQEPLRVSPFAALKGLGRAD